MIMVNVVLSKVKQNIKVCHYLEEEVLSFDL